jgi:hypothetical protein
MSSIEEVGGSERDSSNEVLMVEVSFLVRIEPKKSAVSVF